MDLSSQLSLWFQTIVPSAGQSTSRLLQTIKKANLPVPNTPGLTPAPAQFVDLLAGIFFLSLQSLEHIPGRTEWTRYQVQRSDSLQSAYQGVLATSVTHSGDRAKSEAQNQATARSGSEGRERVLVDGIVKPFQTGPPFPKQVGLGMGRSRASVSIFIPYPLYQEHHFFPCAAGRTPLWRMSPPCKEPGTGQRL